MNLRLSAPHTTILLSRNRSIASTPLFIQCFENFKKFFQRFHVFNVFSDIILWTFILHLWVFPFLYFHPLTFFSSLFCCMLECEYSWRSYNNSNVYGGSLSITSNSLSDCQKACTRDINCRAVDFSAQNDEGWRCYLIMTDDDINVGQIPGVTHYSLAKNCELCICTVLVSRSSKNSNNVGSMRK